MPDPVRHGDHRAEMETADPLVNLGCGQPDDARPGAGTEGGGHHSHHADQVPAGTGSGRPGFPDAVQHDPARCGVRADRTGQNPDPCLESVYSRAERQMKAKENE